MENGRGRVLKVDRKELRRKTLGSGQGRVQKMDRTEAEEVDRN